MKDKIFYLKLVVLVIIIINAVTFNDLNKKNEYIQSFSELESNYVLVEKNILENSFISYLYKNKEDNYTGI